MKPWLVALLTVLAVAGTASKALSQTDRDGSGCGSLSAGECRVAGLRAQFGLGQPQDLAGALLLFEDACERGDTFACTEAGVAHATGYGTPIKPERAKAFYRRGCKPSQHALCRDHGLSYLDPNSPVTHVPKAMSILTEACWVGSVEGCRELAEANAGANNGKEPLFGQIDAIRFYKEACRLGSQDACRAGADMIDGTPALSLFRHVREDMLALACDDPGSSDPAAC